MGDIYMAAAALAVRQLNVLERQSASDTAQLLRVAQPAAPRPRKAWPFLRTRSRRTALGEQPPARELRASERYSAFSHLDRSAIREDPTSKSAERRSLRQARREAAAESARLLLPGHLDPGQLDRRLVGGRDVGLGGDGWRLSVLPAGRQDALLAGLLDERLRAGAGARHGRGASAGPADLRAAQAELLARLEQRRSAVRAARGPPVALPDWLRRAHAELEAEACKDDRARAAAPPLRAAEVHALRQAGGGGRLSDADLVWRERVRTTDWLRRLLARALAHFDADGDGMLSRGEYLLMSRRVYAALHRGYDKAEAEAVARADWEVDSAGGAHVGPRAWASMWLELAELWTTRASLREYGSFILAVLTQVAIAASGPGGPREARGHRRGAMDGRDEASMAARRGCAAAARAVRGAEAARARPRAAGAPPRCGSLYPARTVRASRPRVSCRLQSPLARRPQPRFCRAERRRRVVRSWPAGGTKASAPPAIRVLKLRTVMMDESQGLSLSRPMLDAQGKGSQ